MSEVVVSPTAPVLETEREERPDFCSITRDEIDPRLVSHATWLKSGGRKGFRIDLSGLDLRGIDLRGACLQQAMVRGADLDRADLRGIDLRNADLSDCNLRNADLSDANLRKADLQGATLTRARLCRANLSRVRGLGSARLRDIDLTDAFGLLGTEFAGQDVTGAVLPRDIGRFDGLAHASEVSRQVRTLFLTVVGACAFSWLTIAMTTDQALTTNLATTPLPIIQTNVPIASFYWAAPALLLVLYLYFQLSLQGLWEALVSLPAVFPDGRRLDQRVHTWLLTSLLHAHVPLLSRQRPAFAQLKVGIALFTGWVLVPMTLLEFWLRALVRHDMSLSLIQFLAVVVAVGGGVVFYRKARDTLSHGRSRRSDTPDASDRSGRFGWALLAIPLLAVSYAICDGAIRGDPRRELADRAAVTGLRSWVPLAVAWTGHRSYAALAEASLSRRPDNWWQADDTSRQALTGVTGARLRAHDLRHADLSGAFVAKADLREADLRNALLGHSDLRQANLVRAKLSNALLFDADLREASLGHADLSRARLLKADLRRADLRRSVLTNALLGEADLRDADLSRVAAAGADLQGADLSGANLRRANLWRSNLTTARMAFVNLEETILVEARLQWSVLREASLKRAKLVRSHLQGADLKAADLAGADLRGATLVDTRLAGARLEQTDLRGSDLRRSVLIGANLTGAALSRADLRGAILIGAVLKTAKGLSQAQLVGACGDDTTALPPGLTLPHCPRGGT